MYAIIPTGDHVIFDVAGAGTENDEVFTIPCHSPQTASPDGQNIIPNLVYHPESRISSRISYGTGRDGAPIRPLAAVVSASPLPDYHGLKRPEAAAYLVAHQRVVETVMRDFPTLPVKFGTVLAGESQVTQLLAQGESLFQAALDKYGNRVQMEVVVLWNIQHVFQQIALDETVLQAKAQLASCSPEENLAKRVTLGRQVQAALEQRRAALGGEILPVLQEIAQEMAVNPLMDDTMVLNVALLLDEKGCQALDRTLEVLDASFESRGYTGSSSLVFRRVGPLPPYSFTTIEVQPLSFEVIEDARRLLSLEETTTPKEIQRAYHRQVIQLHPDLNPPKVPAPSGNRDYPEIDASMTRLTQAYRLLTAYAESQSKTTLDRCSLNREAISQAMLITVQQPEYLPQKV
ncbi:MAG: GvpL/GvpF family gas vesicle protein [Chloroflexi bacterium]|nr:GvpL/GvpF family gas vesicle protein [Chloroflexota bacterium]